MSVVATPAMFTNESVANMPVVRNFNIDFPDVNCYVDKFCIGQLTTSLMSNEC